MTSKSLDIEETKLQTYMEDYLDGKIMPPSALSPAMKQKMSPAAKQFRSTMKKDTAISLRLPKTTLDRIKEIARVQGIPYQTLIGSWIHQKITAV